MSGVFGPLLVFTLALSVTGLVACDSDGSGVALDTPDSSAPGTSTASGPSESPSPAESPLSAEEEVVAQFRRLIDVSTHAFDYPSAEWPARMGEVATDPLLSTLLTNLARMDTAGEVLYGEIVLRDPQPMVDGETATVSDCVDSSGHGRRKEDTGEVLSVGVERELVVATLVLGEDGVWRGSELSSPGDPC